jgi:hypothetical protein
MQTFKKIPAMAIGARPLQRRSFRYYVALVLASGLLSSALMLSTKAQNPQGPKKSADGNPIRNNGPSHPVTPFQGHFRVTLNGFTVNHQTNQGLSASSDAIYFLPMASMVDASPEPRFFYGMGTPHESNGFDAGPTDRIGSRLRTGDGFPTRATPWRRTLPPGVSLTQLPPNIYFEGEIIQNTNAVLIIPTIWLYIGNYDLGNAADPVHAYSLQINHDLPALGRAAARIIRGPQPLALASYLRSGASMGLNNTMRLAISVPRDRPIGMQPERDQFGFIPQVLVLTYDSARFISHTSFGFGIGIVPVRYIDPQSLGGDYTLYFQVDECQPYRIGGPC